MLTVFLLLFAAVLVMFSRGLGVAAALLALSLFTRELSFEWMPGMTFGWNILPEYLPLAGAFVLISVLALFSARKVEKRHLAAIVVFVAGLVGFIGASHPLQFFFFMELMIFPAFYIIFSRDPAAAFKYFVYMQLSSLMVLAGIFSTGTISAIFFTLGFGIKMGLFPLGGWLPDAHAQAPTPLSTLLSGCVVACGAYGLHRFAYYTPLLVVMGLLSMLYGSLRAWREDDLKKLLAFSTVSMMGYAAIALVYAVDALPTFLLMHALAKATLFLAAGEIITRAGMRHVPTLRIHSLSLGFSSLVAALSMAGFPPLLGFWTEISILKGLAFSLPVLLVFMAAMLPTFLYVERLLAPFFKEGGHPVESWLPAVSAVALLMGGVLLG